MALTCAIGTDVPMGTVRLPTVLLFVLTDHTCKLLSCCTVRKQRFVCLAAALSLVVHILCIYYARARRFIVRRRGRSLVVAVSLARARLLHMQCVR